MTWTDVNPESLTRQELIMAVNNLQSQVNELSNRHDDFTHEMMWHIKLTKIQAQIVVALLSGRSMTPDQIISAYGGVPAEYENDKIVRVHIHNIRNKMKAKFGHKIIENNWGRGYLIPSAQAKFIKDYIFGEMK